MRLEYLPLALVKENGRIDDRKNLEAASMLLAFKADKAPKCNANSWGPTCPDLLYATRKCLQLGAIESTGPAAQESFRLTEFGQTFIAKRKTTFDPLQEHARQICAFLDNEFDWGAPEVRDCARTIYLAQIAHREDSESPIPELKSEAKRLGWDLDIEVAKKAYLTFFESERTRDEKVRPLSAYPFTPRERSEPGRATTGI